MDRNPYNHHAYDVPFINQRLINSQDVSGLFHTPTSTLLPSSSQIHMNSSPFETTFLVPQQIQDFQNISQPTFMNMNQQVEFLPTMAYNLATAPHASSNTIQHQQPSYFSIAPHISQQTSSQQQNSFQLPMVTGLYYHYPVGDLPIQHQGPMIVSQQASSFKTTAKNVPYQQIFQGPNPTTFASFVNPMNVAIDCQVPPSNRKFSTTTTPIVDKGSNIRGLPTEHLMPLPLQQQSTAVGKIKPSHPSTDARKFAKKSTTSRQSLESLPPSSNLLVNPNSHQRSEIFVHSDLPSASTSGSDAQEQREYDKPNIELQDFDELWSMIEKRRGLGLGTSSSAGNSSTNEKSSDQNTKGMVSSSLIEMLVSQTAKIKAAKSQPQIEPPVEFSSEMRTIIQRRREQELASAGGDNLKQLASLLHTDNKTVHGGTEQSNARPTLLKLEEPMDNIPMSLDRPLFTPPDSPTGPTTSSRSTVYDQIKIEESVESCPALSQPSTSAQADISATANKNKTESRKNAPGLFLPNFLTKGENNTSINSNSSRTFKDRIPIYKTSDKTAGSGNSFFNKVLESMTMKATKVCPKENQPTPKQDEYDFDASEETPQNLVPINKHIKSSPKIEEVNISSTKSIPQHNVVPHQHKHGHHHHHHRRMHSHQHRSLSATAIEIPVKNLSKQKTLAKSMSALKWKQKRHSMESSLHSIIVEEVRDEDYDNNNTIWLNKSEDVKKPELPTCQIKESTSTEGRNKLPKLVIRLGKRSLTQDKDDNNAGTLSQRRFSTTEANISEICSPGVLGAQLPPSKDSSNDINSELLERLKYFHKAKGNFTKGIFLVLKEDLSQSDCPLWRVDNQNMLQKYLPVPSDDDEICYRNSSTYAGWSNQVVEDYLIVEVEHLTNDRLNSMVKPKIPINELFPATSLVDISNAEFNMSKKSNICQPNSNSSSYNTMLENNAKLYIKILLNHSLEPEFIQRIRESNDWVNLCVLNDIDQKIATCLENLKKRGSFGDDFLAGLQEYTKMNAVDDYHLIKSDCQSCFKSDAVNMIQMFSHQSYDIQFLVPRHKRNHREGLFSRDYFVCAECYRMAQIYHNIYHLRYNIYRICEEKIEQILDHSPNKSANEIIKEACEDSEWLLNVIFKYTGAFKEL